MVQFRLAMTLWIVVLASGLWPLFSNTAFAQISAPTQLSGLRLWVDANDVDGTGINPANGSLITQWTDKSGVGNHLTASGSLSPTFETLGFGAGLPSVRFLIGNKMSGPNLFGSNITQPETTIFFVHANVTLTNNFLINLNGDNWSSSTGADGRFSFHMPWGDLAYYFDAGGCCGTTRLQGSYPNSITTITQVSAVNSTSVVPGYATARQLIRFDGVATNEDATGSAPGVTGGMRVGSTTGHSYDGRFGEIIVYDRALSLYEIMLVECYLHNKWKPTIKRSCLPNVSVTKTSTIFDDGSNPLFHTPGTDVIYRVTVSRNEAAPISADSVFVVDHLPNPVTFFNGDYDGSGPATTPVGFVNTGSGLSFNIATDIRYSNAGAPPTSFAACTYTPTVGYDSNVRYICVNPKGAFTSGVGGSSFELFFRGKIQ
jgi:hypothetical protein